MLTWHRIRSLGLSLVAGTLASAALLLLGPTPAGATARSGPCIPLLPQTCVTTTTKAALPPTTKAVTTTTAPRLVPAATTTPPPRTTTTQKVPARAQVGSPGLPAPASGPNDLSALGPGVDPAAPQLAGTAPPTTTANIVQASPPVLPGLVGATRGLPDDHASARIALSIVVLIVALVGAAQLPASRRSPRPRGGGLDDPPLD